MSDLFLFTMNRSIAASWVILAVILARLLLRKAPKTYTCLLWWIVAARLFSAGFPQTSFSLIPSTQTITPESLYDRAPVITSGVEIIDDVVNPVYTESFRADPVASVNPLQVWTAVAANIWLLVMIAIWVWSFISWLRIRRRVAVSVNLRDNIYICDAIDTPFILGVLKPRIYLPSALGESQQRHVIAHEQAHLHRRDHWYKPFAYFLLSINWFNPLMWVAYILLCRDIELACDERVIERMTAGDKKGYSTALLECSIHRHMIAACPLAFGEVGVKERVKAVLRYKKPAFWIVLIAVIICAAFVLFFMTDPVSAQPEIRYNGYLYIQEGGTVDTLPDKIESIGELRSTLHDSTPHPTEDGQSVGLDWEYAGQPLYLVGNALYLEEPGGGSWLIFRLVTPYEFLQDTLKKDLDYVVVADSGQLHDWETLPYNRKAALREILDGLQTTQFEQTQRGLHPASILQIDFYKDSLTAAFNLRLSAEDEWTLHFSDPELGSQVWTFRNAALSEWANPYVERAAYDARLFGDQATTISYRTYENRDYSLTIGLPDGWRSEQQGLTGLTEYDGISFRFWPENAEGFIQVQFENTPFYESDIEYDVVAHTLPNGVTVKRYDEPGGEWDHFEFSTTQGKLYAFRQSTLTWTEEQIETALDILSTLTASVDGADILSEPNHLGIHLSVENPTPSGLTLVVNQDGTPWNSIYTGSNYNVARWYEEQGEWAFLPQREGTAWTMVAYSVPLNETTRTGISWEWAYGKLEPGSYRIYKSYTGERGFLADRESVDQTCYAEFTIE